MLDTTKPLLLSSFCKYKTTLSNHIFALFIYILFDIGKSKLLLYIKYGSWYTWNNSWQTQATCCMRVITFTCVQNPSNCWCLLYARYKRGGVVKGGNMKSKLWSIKSSDSMRSYRNSATQSLSFFKIKIRSRGCDAFSKKVLLHNNDNNNKTCYTFCFLSHTEHKHNT